jgi:hypothetical protein
VRPASLLPALAVACASATPSPAESSIAPAAVDLPRSSIAAVLLHRDELKLTPAQVGGLQQRDDALAREDAALRARVSSGADSGATSSQPAVGTPGRGKHRGGHATQTQTRAPDLLTRLDDDDTRAYLEAEQLLTEEQRPHAREIASAYREALYDQQHPSRSHRQDGADGGSNVH